MPVMRRVDWRVVLVTEEMVTVLPEMVQDREGHAAEARDSSVGKVNTIEFVP